MNDDRTFAYRAVRPDGAMVRDVVRAPDRAAATRRLAQNDLVVLDVRDVAAAGVLPIGARITLAERVALMRQLALMAKAGVDLLEALETIAAGLEPRPIAARLRDAAAALRRGEPLSRAFAESFPSYPAYVHALVRAGEASGRLPVVLAEAADQVAFEDQVRREVGSALTYPLFMVAAGLLAMIFLLIVVVPRFAAMVGDLSSIDPFPAFILGSGLALRDNAVLSVALIAGALFAAGRAFTLPAVRTRLLVIARRIPGLRTVLFARSRMNWARLMSLGLGAGLPVLEATALARASVVEDPPFHRALAAADASIRTGSPIESAFAREHALGAIDASLVRAGARTGSLPSIFAFIANQHEVRLRADLKRLTVVLEQAAIGFVATAIGAVVIGLVTALTGVYEAIQ
jgi:general secretion pathway protein F